jgi:hypothetical protein
MNELNILVVFIEHVLRSKLVNWKKTTEAGRDHKETVLTSLHCTYYPFIEQGSDFNFVQKCQ